MLMMDGHCNGCVHHQICKIESILWKLHDKSFIGNPEKICHKFCKISNTQEYKANTDNSSVVSNERRLERKEIVREENDEIDTILKAMHKGICFSCGRDNVLVRSCRACGKEVCLNCGELVDTYDANTDKTEEGFFCTNCSDQC